MKPKCDYEFHEIIEKKYKNYDDIIGSDLLSNKNKYVRNIESCTDIHVIHNKEVAKAFEKEHICLLHLFIHK